MENTGKMDALEVLSLAMEREKGAQKFYREAARAVADQKAKNMFSWLAREERGHLRKLGLERKHLASTGEWRPRRRFTSKPLRKGDFPPLSEVAGEVKPNATELEALRKGIQAEKDSVELYARAAQETSDPGGRAMFKRLAKEERGHQGLLEAEYRWIRLSGAYFTLHRFSLRYPEGSLGSKDVE
jgi:rubrerythrin